MKITERLLQDQNVRGNDALLDNHIRCHCGRRSMHSRDWWKVQEWWRQHGYGKGC